MIVDLDGKWRQYVTHRKDSEQIPVGAKVLGTVALDDAGRQAGALLELANGEYWMINDQYLGKLNQQAVWDCIQVDRFERNLTETALSVGIVTPAGDKGKTKLRSLSLDDATMEVFRRAGNGNASLGARLIAEKVKFSD